MVRIKFRNPICWLFGHVPMDGSGPQLIVCRRAGCEAYRGRGWKPEWPWEYSR